MIDGSSNIFQLQGSKHSDHQAQRVHQSGKPKPATHSASTNHPTKPSATTAGPAAPSHAPKSASSGSTPFGVGSIGNNLSKSFGNGSSNKSSGHEMSLSDVMGSLMRTLIGNGSSGSHAQSSSSSHGPSHVAAHAPTHAQTHAPSAPAAPTPSSQPAEKKPAAPHTQAPSNGNVKQTGPSLTPKVTAYSPQSSNANGNLKMEGGLETAKKGPDGKNRVETLDNFANGDSKFITVAGAKSQEGKEYMIPSITYKNANGTSKTLENVPAYVTDTGSAFNGKGSTRFDIPVGTNYTTKQLDAEPFSNSNIKFVPVTHKN